MVGTAGYFYSVELGRNWEELQAYQFTLQGGSLAWAVLLFLCGYLLQTHLWQACINRHLGHKVFNFSQSLAVVNSSSLGKYLPGKVWTFAAQMLWLKKYGVSKSLILYVNLICLIASSLISVYLLLAYLWLYTALDKGLLSFVLLALIACNILYVFCHVRVINWLIIILQKIVKQEIAPIVNSRALTAYIQFVYLCAWLFIGTSAYFLTKGVGLTASFDELFVLLASTAFSWIVGYLAVIAPGGLGVREGVMLLMLRNVVNPQLALIYPLVSRLLYLVTEALLALLGLWLGVRNDIFTLRQRQQGEDAAVAGDRPGDAALLKKLQGKQPDYQDKQL